MYMHVTYPVPAKSFMTAASLHAQVKIRGQRVNITEIETVINDCAGVDKAIVLCHHFSEISSVVVAYYTTLFGERQTRIESELTDACRKSLPVYMRPKLLHIGEIPLQVGTRCSGWIITTSVPRYYFTRHCISPVNWLLTYSYRF